MKFTAVVLLIVGIGSMFGQMLSIDSIDATIGEEKIFLNTGAEPWELDADFFNVYRDTAPIFYWTQIDSDKLLPNRAFTADYTDDFDDPFWPDYVGSSKGIGDTLVNLFYVVSAVDSLEPSFRLSNCAGEYDQGMKSSSTAGSVNFISIPTYDERWTNASDLSEFGVSTVQEWHAVTQTWLTVGVEVVSGVWSPDDPLQLSHVYRVSGADIPSETIFTTSTPGIVPSTDTTYSLHSDNVFGNQNVIMLPFQTAYIDGIDDCASLEASIVATGADEILSVERWNSATKTWELVGSKLPVGVWSPNGELRPGLPYRIRLESTSPVNWPLN
ncbi:MAG TPA: hypothetical protein ENN75_03720 [candidate division Zixibacteria bacterium]|nr:hypothetical protein [candidate division Zixibacteria bacterium]